MNRFIIKTLSVLVSAAAVMAFVFTVNTQTVRAAGINENIPCSSSAMIAMNDSQPGTTCWPTSTTGYDGEYFTVLVTVANSAPITAPNVTVDIDNPGNGSGNSFTFSEEIRVNGTLADADDSARINIGDGPGELELVGGYRYIAGQGGAGTPVNVSQGNGYLRINMGNVPSGEVYSAKFEFQIHSDNTPPPVDVCPNISGVQTSVPNGYFINNNGNCIPNPTIDVCPNLPGNQSSVPNGYHLDNNGNCVQYQNDDLIVDTNNAEDVDEDSARLEGTIINDGGMSVPNTYFYLSTSYSAVQNGSAQVYTSTAGNLNSGEDFSRVVTNLNDDTTYYFKACGENAYDEDCGSVEDFHTGEKDTTEDLEVVTNSPDNVDDNSATLTGEIEEGDNIDVWFELSDDKDDVEDGDGEVYNVSNDQDDGDDFEKNVSGLDDDTKYYYRACGENEDGDEDCGSIKSFTTGEDYNEPNPPTTTSTRPAVSTLPASSIGQTSAQCNGVFASNGASTTTYFKYGTNPNGLTFVTNSSQQGISSGPFYAPIAGLMPNTLYYCQAWAQNSKGTVYGDAVAFRTLAVSVNNPPVVTNTVFVNNGTGGGRANILIENDVDTLFRGQQVVYHIEYKNISRTELENTTINVEFPKEVRPLATTRGTISKSGNAVTVKEDSFGVNSEEEFFVTAEVRGGTATPGQLLTASATLAYDYEPGEKTAVEEAIAFDADTFTDNGGLLAGLALFGGFFPGSLAGWLILLLVLLIILAIIRRYYVVAPRYHYDNVPHYDERRPPQQYTRPNEGMHPPREY